MTLNQQGGRSVSLLLGDTILPELDTRMCCKIVSLIQAQLTKLSSSLLRYP